MNGKEKLWNWFGLSRASWLTLPRSMMHEMPQEWQSKMADLLDEWDDTYNTSHLPLPVVCAKDNGKFKKWPEWVINYRHPDLASINSCKSDKEGDM